MKWNIVRVAYVLSSLAGLIVTVAAGWKWD